VAIERATAAEVINQAALECGLLPVADPYVSTDPAFVQMCGLLNTAGRALGQLYPWEQLRKSHQITTDALDTGSYELPDDFYYMINQTGWELTNRYPLLGPSSPQEWAFLNGRGLISSTIYVVFRMNAGEFQIYPNDPVVDGLDINFDYISRYWVAADPGPTGTASKATVSTDIILYEQELIACLLKVKWLDAKQFNSDSAKAEFQQLLDSYTGKNTGAKILNAGSYPTGFPYLNIFNNVPDGNWNQ